MPLLRRSNPLEGESLSSYMHRVSKANFVTVHDLWRFISPVGVHYPQSSMSSNIDICPVNLIDLKKFDDLLLHKYQSLEVLSFIPVLEKMDIPKKAMAASRSLSGLIATHRKFCQECLKQSNSYKLIWQVQELKFCPEHHTQLQCECTNCNKAIPILPSNSDLGACPYCNFDLSNCNSNTYITTDIDYRILNDWSYLLDNSVFSLNSIEAL